MALTCVSKVGVTSIHSEGERRRDDGESEPAKGRPMETPQRGKEASQPCGSSKKRCARRYVSADILVFLFWTSVSSCIDDLPCPSFLLSFPASSFCLCFRLVVFFSLRFVKIVFLMFFLVNVTVVTVLDGIAARFLLVGVFWTLIVPWFFESWGLNEDGYLRVHASGPSFLELKF